MRMIALTCLLAAMVCCAANSQTTVFQPVVEFQKLAGPSEAGPVMTPSVRPGPKGPEEPAVGAESPRMTRLKQLTFDRRPSTILKVWAPELKGKPPEPNPDPKAEALNKEIALFQKNVTLGQWPAVRDYLAGLPDQESRAGYDQLLRTLSQGGIGLAAQADQQAMMMNPQMMQFAERNAFSADDLVGLAAAVPRRPNPVSFAGRLVTVGAVRAMVDSPWGLTKEHLTQLGGVLREAVAGGTLPEVAVRRLKVEEAKPAGQGSLTRRQIARLLTDAALAEHAGDFLPTPEQALKDGDLEALNLLSRHFIALHALESKSGNLEKAWSAVQSLLANPTGPLEEKSEALLRAVELAPRLKDELGQAWLDASFTKNPERGMEILSAVGGLVSKGIASRPMQNDERLNSVKLMKTAVEALLKASPDRARQWQSALTLCAAAWLHEAEFSQRFDRSAGAGARLRRDMYGNIFFGNDDEDPMTRMMMQQQNMPRPVPVADMIKAAPTPAWVAAVDDSLRPKLADAVARLHLKANEEEKAFPFIEQLAPAQPANARELVKEFLRVWIRTHDPNAAKNENRYSWFFFAFEQRSEGIPLTRSKQERNLRELAAWTARIKKLPAGAGELDDELMVKAFTNCHSSAEVYRTPAIEAVFGPMGGLKPKTLAGLADQMRTNMAGLWKEPAVQQQGKTNRKKKDIEAEVLRGYEVARGVIDDGLKKFPEHWSLLTAKAGLIHDEVNYRQELNKSSDFSKIRMEAFALYRRAAAEYGKAVRTIPADEQSTSVHEQWFAAGLGAVDLGMISEEKQPDWAQPPLIRAAIDALPGDLAEKHLAKFANNLFIKMSGAKPHVKFNYLKAGFAIVGDHKQAVEAKKVFDYYKDLVTEIKLDAVVDGSTRVGSGQPFGLFVNIRHTRDIERESGGFGKYLQNQNSQSFSYNYGRPTADYRDRFEQAARAALKEQFDVVSFTFRDEKVTSRATAEFGWRYTPYAYILMKPKGPQVDKIPPLRIDLDFLDTSGYVVMPVESPAVPIDARDAKGDSRPVDKLVVTQTLDERQADKGVLLLEVKGVGVGLVPDLAELCEVKPEGFEITKTDTQGLGVKKFDEDADQNVVVSERSWLLTLKGRSGLASLPKSFTFGTVKAATKENEYMRFVDADLQKVGQEITLEKTYGSESNRTLWFAGIGAVVGLGGLFLLIRLMANRPKAEQDAGLPENLDAFTTAALLRDARLKPGLAAASVAAIDRDIALVEEHFFAAESSRTPAPDLRKLVERWLK